MVNTLSNNTYYADTYRLTVYCSKPQLIMEYSKSIEAKQGTDRGVLVLLNKSIHEDPMRYSIPIQAEDDGRNSMLVASAVYLNNTR